jgi:hypothetical protein
MAYAHLATVNCRGLTNPGFRRQRHVAVGQHVPPVPRILETTHTTTCARLATVKCRSLNSPEYRKAHHVLIWPHWRCHSPHTVDIINNALRSSGRIKLPCPECRSVSQRRECAHLATPALPSHAPFEQAQPRALSKKSLGASKTRVEEV